MTRKRTRRKHWPLVDAIRLARDRVALLTPERRDELHAPAAHAFDALRRGQGSVALWRDLADACNVAEALIELQIGTNLGHLVQAAQAALAALMARVKAGGRWTLYPAEIGALRDCLWLCRTQLGLCDAGEHRRAVENVRNRIAGALAGSAGPGVTVHQAPAITPTITA